MPPKLATLIAIAVVVLMTGGAGAMVAWDVSRDGVIADDVRVGPLELDGMTCVQARSAITDRLVKPLHQTLVIQAAGTSFALSAREAQISADIEAMLDAASGAAATGGVSPERGARSAAAASAPGSPPRSRTPTTPCSARSIVSAWPSAAPRGTRR